MFFDKLKRPLMRAFQFVKKVVCRGGASTRPQILHSKICRRQAKLWLFPFGKSEKLRFRRAITDRPYRIKYKTRFFVSLKRPLMRAFVFYQLVNPKIHVRLTNVFLPRANVFSKSAD